MSTLKYSSPVLEHAQEAPQDVQFKHFCHNFELYVYDMLAFLTHILLFFLKYTYTAKFNKSQANSFFETKDSDKRFKQAMLTSNNFKISKQA